MKRRSFLATTAAAAVGTQVLGGVPLKAFTPMNMPVQLQPDDDRCLIVVQLSRVLPAPEIALLGLLEVIFGVLWAWLGAGEAPSSAALLGGAMVLAALVGNELLGLRAGR